MSQEKKPDPGPSSKIKQVSPAPTIPIKKLNWFLSIGLYMRLYSLNVQSIFVGFTFFLKIVEKSSLYQINGCNNFFCRKYFLWLHQLILKKLNLIKWKWTTLHN